MNKIDVNNLYKIGFIDEKLVESIDLIKEIKILKKKKNAIIIAHYYQLAEVQEIADFVGDSLALAQKAEKNSADIIVMAGVNFMAETVKILEPNKKILLPDLNASCSLADSCQYDEFAIFTNKYPNYKVITYINTYASIKALSFVCCTSSNAVKIVNSFKTDKLIFAPDQNLGNYVKSITNRTNMIIWPGACHVHKKFSLQKLLELKKKYSDALIIAHPECDKTILINSDFIGSTSQLIDFVGSSNKYSFIVGTEPGVLHQMRKYNGNKLFIPLPPEDSDCLCNECCYMKMINLRKIYLTLKYELPEIVLSKEILAKAYLPIKRMIDLS